MKNIYKIFVLFLFAFGATSCDKNVDFDILTAQESLEILTPTNGSIIVLDDTNLSNNALFISWSTPADSDGVNYIIEVDKTGTGFETPYLLGESTTTNFSMNVGELNSFLLDVMGLDPEKANSLDIRVLANGEVSLVISIIVTPFIVEIPELFLVGSMTDPAWSPEAALPMTRLDFNIFEITVDLADGDEFKFIPTNTSFDGDWGEDPDNPGMLIDDGEQNLKGFPAGKYKITINFNTFTFITEEILAPLELFLVGSLTGWDPGTSLPFLNNGNNIFTIVIDLPAGGEFKFLPQNTSFDGDWGADPNNSGSIIQDGEENVKGFPSGKYLVTVDFNTLTFKLDSVDNLFLVGSLTGWDPATSLSMGAASLGIFSTIIDLPAGAEFKFLPQNTGWDGDWGADPTNLGAIIQDGEQNLSGFAAGKYVVAVNFNTLTSTVSSISGVPAELYLVGAFNGWSNDQNNPQFTEISSGVFEITQALSAGDEFKFVPVAGDWGNDWGENSASSGVLEQNSEQNLRVDDTDTYKITVDFNNGIVALTTTAAVPLDPKYIVGDGVPDAGWGWNSPVEMTQTSTGIWSATTTFANDAFRFFDINGDWGSGTNYPFYANDGFTIDSNLEDAQDGDNNFKFIGTPGVYTITLDTNNKTITLSN